MKFTVLLQGFNPTGWLNTQYTLISTEIERSLSKLIDGFAGRLPYLVAAIIVLLLFWLTARGLRWVFLSSTRTSKMNTQLRILISRLIVVVMFVIGLFTALSVAVESFNFGQVIAGLGFTSFIVGFATKDILNNFLSGILILWQRPFNIGDQLFIGSNQGKVEYIGVRATMLRKDDGEAVLIPNGEMYSSAITIRGAGKQRRMNLKFPLAYDADIEKAKATIRETLASIKGVDSSSAPNVYVTDFTTDGAMVTVQFWIDTQENKPLEVFDEVSIKILSALNGIYTHVYPKATATENSDDQSASESRKKDEAI